MSCLMSDIKVIEMELFPMDMGKMWKDMAKMQMDMAKTWKDMAKM